MKRQLPSFLAGLLGAVIAFPLLIVAQDWYQASGVPVQRSALNSADLRTEFASIETAMDKLPTLTGNGSKLIAVNSGGTALEALSSGLSVAGGGTGATTLTGLLQGNGTSAFTTVTNSSTVGETLRVTGANTYVWGALNLADSDAITGDIPDGNLSANVALYNASMAGFTSGDLADARLSANVPLLDISNTFTGAAFVLDPAGGDDEINVSDGVVEIKGDLIVNGAVLEPVTGTFTASFATACTTTPTIDFSYTITGNLVTIQTDSTPSLNCTGDSTFFASGSSDLPVALDLDIGMVSPVLGVEFVDNGVATAACVRIGDRQLAFWKWNGASCEEQEWTASGVRAISDNRPFSFSYLLPP